MKSCYIALSFLFFPLYIQSSEHLKQLYYPTDKLVQKKLDIAYKLLEKNLQAAPSWGFEVMYIHNDYHCEVAEIVLKAGVGMCDQEKLQLLTGDAYYKKRKEIVCALIQSVHNAEEKRFNPCSITYQATNPLLESIVRSDVAFARYLLENGAQPDQEILQRAQESSSKEIRKLFFLIE